MAHLNEDHENTNQRKIDYLVDQFDDDELEYITEGRHLLDAVRQEIESSRLRKTNTSSYSQMD